MKYILQSFLMLLIVSLNEKMYAQQTVGLFTDEPASMPGYVLFAPFASNTTYLIDKCGKEIHTWTSAYHPGATAELLPDGNLLRAGDANNTTFSAGGKGGVIEKFDWDSTLLWTYTISSSTECQHHEAKQLPNGNVLAICWESHPAGEAVQAGRNPVTVSNTLWSEKIVELQPIGTDSAEIVWEWRVWDHLVQDFDASKPNYGVVTAHPELINLNYTQPGQQAVSDWLHVNAVDYNPEFNQIMVSCHNFSELWIIDHSTTKAQAASHTGGMYGKGGDLLYRWGNPQTYNRGTSVDQKFFGQHNPHWIENGFPDGGKIMIYNNGINRPSGNYSTVDIIAPPVDVTGHYILIGSAPYLPDSAEWHYQATNPFDLFSVVLSSAQRLSNGNTLIDEGTDGNFIEIDPDKNTVWFYINPVGISGPVNQGTTPFMNSAFRCTLYEASYPGFDGHILTPGAPVELNPLPYICNMLSAIGEVKSNADEGFSAVNPFFQNIVLFPSQNLYNASVTLTDATGRIMALWKGNDFTEGQQSILPVNKNMAPGIYFLNIKNSMHNFSVKLVHQP